MRSIRECHGGLGFRVDPNPNPKTLVAVVMQGVGLWCRGVLCPHVTSLVQGAAQQTDIVAV